MLPPGSVLVIEPERSTELWELGEAIQNPLVAKQDKESPLMLHIRLDNVLMPEARKLTLARAGEGAGRIGLRATRSTRCSSGRPGQAGQGKVVVLTVNLDKSDLPLQTAFPIMMANLLNWFGGTKGELREALPAGAVAQVEIAPGRTQSLARYLRRSRRPRAAVSSPPRVLPRLTVGPLDQCGVWSVVERAGSGRVEQDASLLRS